jgi:hypothetical protein
MFLSSIDRAQFSSPAIYRGAGVGFNASILIFDEYNPLRAKIEQPGPPLQLFTR